MTENSEWTIKKTIISCLHDLLHFWYQVWKIHTFDFSLKININNRNTLPFFMSCPRNSTLSEDQCHELLRTWDVACQLVAQNTHERNWISVTDDFRHACNPWKESGLWCRLQATRGRVARWRNTCVRVFNPATVSKRGKKPGGLLDVNEEKDETKEGRWWKIKGEEG